MRKLIKKLVIEGLVLVENKLYNDKIISGVTKKIGDSSDDTLNKLAIAGLYRNIFGNIQQLKTKEQLDDIFKGWYDTAINNMVKTTAFIDNKDLAKKFLDAYVKNIKSLGNKAQPFSLKKIEKGLVDLVNCGGIPKPGVACGEGWIKDNSIKQNNDIYNPKDEDKVHEDDNVVILDTNTKAKCVMYGTDEPWCITKPELNYYNTYRIKYGATPYFVLQKNVEGNEHKLVIMHYKGGYAIADRSNTGDRAGGNQSTTYTWNYIVSQIPNLKGLEKYFPYREITEDEKRYEEIIKRTKGYKGVNLQGYIDNEIKGLIINGSQVEAKDFIRDYAAEGDYISDGQIKSLRPEVINSLIEGGYFLSKGSEQTDLLSSNQYLRVIRIKIQNNEKLSYSDIQIILDLPKNEGDEYLSEIKLDSDIVETLLIESPRENRLEMINRIVPFIKDEWGSWMVRMLMHFSEDDLENGLEMINRIFPFIKDKLDVDMLSSLMANIPEEGKVEVAKLICQLSGDNLNKDVVNILMNRIPEEDRFKLAIELLPFIKDKLGTYYGIVRTLLNDTPEENKHKLAIEILPLIKDKWDSNNINALLHDIPKENKLMLATKIISLFKDKLDAGMIISILINLSKEGKYSLIKQIYPLIKDKLNDELVTAVLFGTPDEYRADVFKEMVPLVMNYLNDDTISAYLEMIPREHHKEIITLVNNAKGVSESILRIKQLFK